MLESEAFDVSTMDVAVDVPSIVEESLLTPCTSSAHDQQITSADNTKSCSHHIPKRSDNNHVSSHHVSITSDNNSVSVATSPDGSISTCSPPVNVPQPNLATYICCFNARSLVNKLSKFQSFVYASKFNVFCVTETWLSNYIYDCEILPTDFVLYRKDRPSRGGGVLIAVKSSFHSSLIPSPSDVEVISVKLGSDQDFILVQFMSHLTQLIFMFPHYSAI